MNTIGLLLSIYILLEAVDAIRSMRGGLHRFCHKLKYIAALGISVYMVYEMYNNDFAIADVFALITVALFVWPRTVYRLNNFCSGGRTHGC